MSYLRDRIRYRLGIQVPILPPPSRARRPPNKVLPQKIPQPTAGVMKTPVKTYGTGQEPISIFGAIPISQQRVRESQKEARAEEAAHEKELTAPIKSYKTRTEFGLGLLDPNFVRQNEIWWQAEKALFPNYIAQVDAILPNAQGIAAPIKTFRG